MDASHALAAAAVWLLPAADRGRYRREFAAELAELAAPKRPAHAARLLIVSPRLSFELRRAAAAARTAPARSMVRASWALVASAVCTAFMVLHRWAGACEWGRFDADPCFRRQDDSYDAARLAGSGVHPEVAAIVLAWSLVAVATLLTGRASGTRPAAWAGRLSVPVCLLVASAASGVGSGLFDWLPRGVGFLVVLFAPQVLVVVAAAGAAEASGRWLSLALVGIALAPTSLLVDMSLVTSITGYMSHDTQPWSFAPTALGLLACAAVLCRMAGGLVRSASAESLPPIAASA